MRLLVKAIPIRAVMQHDIILNRAEVVARPAGSLVHVVAGFTAGEMFLGVAGRGVLVGLGFGEGLGEGDGAAEGEEGGEDEEGGGGGGEVHFWWVGGVVFEVGVVACWVGFVC